MDGSRILYIHTRARAYNNATGILAADGAVPKVGNIALLPFLAYKIMRVYAFNTSTFQCAETTHRTFMYTQYTKLYVHTQNHYIYRYMPIYIYV